MVQVGEEVVLDPPGPFPPGLGVDLLVSSLAVGLEVQGGSGDRLPHPGVFP